MQTLIEESVITQKTRELCQTILDQPEVQTILRQVESFMSNEEAKTQYQLLSEKGEFLQHKQQQGLPLSNEEIADFEQRREALFNNPVARGFLDAQQEMHKMQDSLGQYVAKTFELGRVPSPDDFPSGSCGSGCGCHH